MEEKKHLKNFKCQNPECKHEFLADEFEALECPVCHGDEIAPAPMSWKKYAGMAAVIIIILLILIFLNKCEGDKPQLTLAYYPERCELVALVDGKENQEYDYVLDNNPPIRGYGRFKFLSVGKHTVRIYPIDSYLKNTQQTPLGTKPWDNKNPCNAEGSSNPSSSGQAQKQIQLQVIGIKPGKGLIIDFQGGQGTEFEFSISGSAGPFQRNPLFPDAKCKVYPPGDLVVKCIGDGQIADNPFPLRFDGCKQIVSNNPLPPNGENTEMESLFSCLSDGSCGIGDSYDINPGDMSATIKVFHSSSTTPEVIPFYDYMVRVKADKTIKISKVTSDFKWGTDSKGKQVPMPINIKVYETN